MPSHNRCHEIGREPDVDGACQSAARDAHPGRTTQPCLFQLVDAEMRCDGSVEALSNEYFIGFFGGNFYAFEGTGIDKNKSQSELSLRENRCA